MEKEIHNFIVVVGNNVDEELEGYKLFTVNGDLKVKNQNILANLQARDVNVVRSAGRTFWNLVTGKPTVQGGLELDKIRQANFKEELFFIIKQGKPAVGLAFPDRFEDLPESLKKHKYLGTALKLTYMQMQAINQQRELLEEAGFNQTEIWDKLTQSQTKATEYINKMIQDLTNNQQKAITKETEEKKKREEGELY